MEGRTSEYTTELFASKTVFGSMKLIRLFLGLMLTAVAVQSAGQNLVTNGSFEIMDNCPFPQPSFDCVLGWSQPSTENDPSNTPDIGFEGAVFFPPSSIDAYDGNNYLNIESSTGNPEYAQQPLSSPMQAGVSYCVTFYASVNDQSPTVAPSLGIYFSAGPISNSPFELGLNAHVQGPVAFDPTSWTRISGMYTATGDETYIVVAGFENNGSMPFPYMYVDQISVVAMPVLVLEDQSLCSQTEIELDAFSSGASYLWSTGETTALIVTDTAGIYSIIRTIGACAQMDSVEVFSCGIDNPDDTTDFPGVIPSPGIPVIPPVDPYFIPNAFTPDGDGINDVFRVYGPQAVQYKFSLFNRWGEVIFTSTDVEDYWTGNTRDGDYYIRDGVYVYRLVATLPNFQVIEKTGHVVVLR